MATAFHSHHAEQRWLRAPYTVARKYTDKTVHRSVDARVRLSPRP
jgi:hypothetical protein